MFPFSFPVTIRSRSRSITNTMSIGNPVIALTVLTQRAARLRLSLVGNPDFPYIASSILLSIKT